MNGKGDEMGMKGDGWEGGWMKEKARGQTNGAGGCLDSSISFSIHSFIHSFIHPRAE